MAILSFDLACGDDDDDDNGNFDGRFQIEGEYEDEDGIIDLILENLSAPKNAEIKAVHSDYNAVTWNCPMCTSESPQSAKGNFEIAECLAVLTRESVSALNEFGLAPKMSHIIADDGTSLDLNKEPGKSGLIPVSLPEGDVDIDYDDDESICSAECRHYLCGYDDEDDEDHEDDSIFFDAGMRQEDWEDWEEEFGTHAKEYMEMLEKEDTTECKEPSAKFTAEDINGAELEETEKHLAQDDAEDINGEMLGVIHTETQRRRRAERRREKQRLRRQIQRAAKSND